MSNLFSVKSYTGNYTVEVYENEESEKKRREVLKVISKSSFLVIDKKISQLHPQIIKYWDREFVYVIEAKESNKELETCQNLIKALTSVAFKKDMAIVAIGGGITQDVSSFVASVLYRGVDWIFIPTTLLAQADSCMGSKTSINFNGVKNNKISNNIDLQSVGIGLTQSWPEQFILRGVLGYQIGSNDAENPFTGEASDGSTKDYRAWVQGICYF